MSKSASYELLVYFSEERDCAKEMKRLLQIFKHSLDPLVAAVDISLYNEMMKVKQAGMSEPAKVELKRPKQQAWECTVRLEHHASSETDCDHVVAEFANLLKKIATSHIGRTGFGILRAKDK